MRDAARGWGARQMGRRGFITQPLLYVESTFSCPFSLLRLLLGLNVNFTHYRPLTPPSPRSTRAQSTLRRCMRSSTIRGAPLYPEKSRAYSEKRDSTVHW